MTMIIRTPRKERFTIVDNQMLEDDRLSFKAKGVLAYLLSRPDNWTSSETQLAKIGPDGSSAMRSALDELRTVGYLVTERRRNDDGTFRWEHFIYDSPQHDTPQVENPQEVKPQEENRPLTNTIETNTGKTNTEEKAAAAAPVRACESGNPAHEVEKESRAGSVQEVWKAWGDNMPGVLTPILVDGINDLLEDFNAAEVVRAIGIACERNRRTLSYVRGILERGVELQPPKPKGKAPPGRAFIVDPVTGQRKEVLL